MQPVNLVVRQGVVVQLNVGIVGDDSANFIVSVAESVGVTKARLVGFNQIPPRIVG